MIINKLLLLLSIKVKPLSLDIYIYIVYKHKLYVLQVLDFCIICTEAFIHKYIITT